MIRASPPSALALTAALAAAVPARGAETTTLADRSGVLRLEAPGKWRKVETTLAFAAVGYLDVKRTELYAALYPGAKDAAAAAQLWKDERIRRTPALAISHPSDDPLRWVAHDAGANAVEYGRALAGADTAAVVWARLTGEPGAADREAFAILDAARLEKPAPAPDASGPGGPGGPTPPAAETAKFKDRAFVLEITLPRGFEERKDVRFSERHALSLKGPVGKDPEAFLDVFAFPDFDRADAAGWWWVEEERRGWLDGVRIEGRPPAFLVLPAGRTWTRHVRILETKGGVFGIRIDVDAASDAAAEEMLAGLAEGRGLAVRNPRPEQPNVPAGFAQLDADTYVAVHEVDAGQAAALLREATAMDGIARELLGLEPAAPRRGVLRVFKDQAALDAALKAYEVPAGKAAHWCVPAREVWTRAGVLDAKDTRGQLDFELVQETLQRRLGLRAPFWLSTGLGLVCASAAYNRGRVDQPHPAYLEAARNATGTSVEFETVRWWAEKGSAGDLQREAVAWGFVYLLTEGTPVSTKWQGPFRRYVQVLRETGSPAEAGKAFDFTRDGELVDDWRKRMRK